MRLSDVTRGIELEHSIRVQDVEFYPPQEEAIKAGLLDTTSNFVIATPTASGKTLLAELVMLQSVVRDSGKCLYVVPLNALAGPCLC